MPILDYFTSRISARISSRVGLRFCSLLRVFAFEPDAPERVGFRLEGRLNHEPMTSASRGVYPVPRVRRCRSSPMLTSIGVGCRPTSKQVEGRGAVKKGGVLHTMEALESRKSRKTRISVDVLAKYKRRISSPIWTLQAERELPNPTPRPGCYFRTKVVPKPERPK